MYPGIEHQCRMSILFNILIAKVLKLLLICFLYCLYNLSVSAGFKNPFELSLKLTILFISTCFCATYLFITNFT